MCQEIKPEELYVCPRCGIPTKPLFVSDLGRWVVSCQDCFEEMMDETEVIAPPPPDQD